MKSSYSILKSKVGDLTLRWAGDALVGVYFDCDKRLGQRAEWRRDDACLAPVREQLEQYFAGERTTFDLPLAFEGTAFQTSVWKQLVHIPYGETTTYGELATRIGKPEGWSGSRAIGAANGQNPLVVIVPCHRVIGASGALTGFGGGLPRKKWLLGHEGVSTADA